jgi:preprotein translocase subunit SecF
MFDIVRRRYWYFGLSLLVIVPGLIFMGLNWAKNPAQGPLPLAIDFTGGTLLEVQFKETTRPVEPAQVRLLMGELGFPDSTVQTSGADIAIIRSKELSEPDKQEIIAALEALYGPATVLTAETVGPSVGAEVARSAALAVGAAAVGILAYIWWAFRRLPHAFRYSVCAIIAMLHDVLVVVGTAAIFGYIFHWEVDALFLTALLTVVGFSVHDTIVVFDRIRENLIIHRRLDYETVVNHSIVQTLDRSINTQLTVMFTLLALALFGGDTLRHFVVTLLIGVFSGTYSSIFNAAPLLVVWENREWGNLFRRRTPAAA